MFKKFPNLMLPIFLLFSFLFASAFSYDLPITVDGKKVSGDVPFAIKDNRIYVPLRFVSEALGAKVTWMGAQKKAIVSLKNTSVTVTIGNTQAKVGEFIKSMDTAPMILKNRTMVPVRFLAENLDFTVNYDNKTGVSIVSKKNITPTTASENLFTTVTWKSLHSNDIDLIIKVKNLSNEKLTVNLQDGQDIEVLLYDSDKKLVWKYSQDKFFTMATRTVSFAANEEKQFNTTIPYQKIGDYTAEVYYYGISRNIPIDVINIKVDWEPSS